MKDGGTGRACRMKDGPEPGRKIVESENSGNYGKRRMWQEIGIY